MEAEYQNQIHVQNLILQQIQVQFGDMRTQHYKLEDIVRDHMEKEEKDRLLLIDQLHKMELRLKAAEVKIALYVAGIVGVIQLIPVLLRIWL